MAEAESLREIEELVASVREEGLRADVERFSGLRHGQWNPEALAQKADALGEQLEAAGLAVEREEFRYRGQTYCNVVAVRPGRNPALLPFLVGA